MNTQNIFIRFGRTSLVALGGILVFFIKLLDSATDFDDTNEAHTDPLWQGKEVFRSDRYTDKEIMTRRPR